MNKQLLKFQMKTVRLLAAAVIVSSYQPTFGGATVVKSKTLTEKREIYKHLLDTYQVRQLKEIPKPKRADFKAMFNAIATSTKESPAGDLFEHLKAARLMLAELQGKLSNVEPSPEKVAFHFVEMPTANKVLKTLFDSNDANKNELARKIIDLWHVDSLEILSKRHSDPEKSPDLTEDQIEELTTLDLPLSKWIASRLHYVFSKIETADEINIRGFSGLLDKILKQKGGTVAEKIQNLTEAQYLEIFKKILKCK